MSESHVVTGLIAKRAEMAGLMAHHQQEIDKLASSLSHLDATLKLFAPEMDMRSLRPKKRRERSVIFRSGEAPRCILDILRKAQGPLTSREIVERVLVTRQLEATPERIAAVQKSILTVIKGLEGKKLAQVSAAVGKGGVRSWEIV